MKASECPKCSKKAVGFLRKAFGVGINKFDCPHCGECIGASKIAAGFITLLFILLAYMLIGAGFSRLVSFLIVLPLVLIGSWLFLPLVPKTRNGVA